MANVKLSGYQGPKGFRPERVYDPSQQIQEQGRQLVQQMQSAGTQFQQTEKAKLDALAGFSQTLTSTLKERQESKNKQEYALGLADVMNGRSQIPEGMKEQHAQKVESLRLASDADSEVANNIENSGDLALAEEFRANSRSISGWRAYGQAVGLAKKSALGSQAFMTEFMNSQEAIIPTADGAKSPAQIANSGSPPEIEATLAIAQQKYFEQQGLAAINPIVLAENFAPTFNQVREQVKANTISAVAANRREDAQVEIINNVQTATLDENATSDSYTATFQQATEQLMSRANLSKGKASALTLTTMVESIKLLPSDQAMIALEKLRKAVKVSATGQTLGELEKDVFLAAESDILNKERQEEARQLEDENKEIARLKAELEAVRSSETDPEKLRAAETNILGQINAYARKSNINALNIMSEERQKALIPEDTALFNQYIQRTDLTIDQIDALPLPENKKAILRNRAVDRERIQFEKEYGSLVRLETKASLASSASVKFDAFGKPTEGPAIYNAYNQAVEDKLFDYIQQRKQQGLAPDANEISQKLKEITQQTYVQYFDKGGKALKLGIPTTKLNAKGQTVYDVSDVEINKIDPRYDHPSVAILLDKATTISNLERYKEGFPLTQRASKLTSGLDTVSFLKTQAIHHGIDPTPYFGGERGQSESANRRSDPVAAQFFYFSDTDEEQARSATQLAEARQRQQRLSQAPAQGTVPDTQILQLALDQGIPENQAVIMLAIALGESGGRSGIDTVQSGLDVNKTNEYSIGLWQINMSAELGEERARDLKLSSYDQLRDPATNARAMKYILDRQGLNAWTVYKTGKYKQYLPDAKRALIQLKKQRR